ncbi:MAG: TetR/AcrR family transcriptional regulator [Rhodobacteraceae bacterium]|nr:TetR/AcrR family transcriptional regulator [Paracoccaceae bacterium]
MNVHSGPIKKGRKYDHVLNGAREIFLRDGFEGASVDAIAKAAGVSKATLYSYFSEKSILFIEVARTECSRQADHAMADLDLSAPPREVMSRAGHHMMEFLLSDFGQQTFRTLIAESARFPDLGREFYMSIHERVQETMGTYFDRANARGELKIDDPELAADQFHELCKASLWPRIMFHVQDSYTEAEVDRIVDAAVDMFMARYGA